MLLFAKVTGAPTGLTAAKTEGKTVQLFWTAPASNTPPVAGYELFYAETGSNITQSGGLTTDSTISVTLPKLSVLYDFFVVAFSNENNALPSARSTNITIFFSSCKFNS